MALFLLLKNMELLIVLTLSVLLIIHEIISYRERQSMLDRLMAKNLPEYKDNQTTQDNTIDEIEDDTVPLEDAEEEVVGEK